MYVSTVCKDYFGGFRDLSAFKKNNSCNNLLGICKIVSYFTVVAPLLFGVLYGIDSLIGRIRHTPKPLGHASVSSVSQKVFTAEMDYSLPIGQTNFTFPEDIVYSSEFKLANGVCLFDDTATKLLRVSKDGTFIRLHRMFAVTNGNRIESIRHDTLPVFFEGIGFKNFTNKDQAFSLRFKDHSCGQVEICEHELFALNPKRRWLVDFTVIGHYNSGYAFFAKIS